MKAQRQLRALIYTRVSADKSGRLRSPQEQEAHCRRECERNGWHIVDVLTDGSMSGSEYAKHARPQWQRVLTMIAKREFDVLVVWSSSRATRNVPEGITMLEEMRATRVRLVEAGKGGAVKGTVLYSYDGRCYNPDDPEDLHRMRQNVIDDAHKSDRTSYDVSRALATNAAEGRPHGKVPYAYERLANGTQRPHPTEAPILIEAAQRMLAGQSSLSVVAWLDEVAPLPQRYTKEGRAWGKPGWRLNRLKYILTNPVYAGYREFKGELIKAEWPPLWEYTTTQALVGLYAAEWRKQARNNPGRRYHLLSGIAKCGACDKPLYAGMASGRTRKVYRCQAGHVSVDRAWLDTLVSAALLKGITKGYRAIEVGPTPEQVNLESRVALVRAKLDAANSAMDASDDPSELGPLARTAAKHEATLAELEGELAAERRKRKVRPTITAELAAADDPSVAWDGMTAEERGVIIRDQLSVVVNPVTKHLGNMAVFDETRIEMNWLDDNAEAA